MKTEKALISEKQIEVQLGYAADVSEEQAMRGQEIADEIEDELDFRDDAEQATDWAESDSNEREKFMTEHEPQTSVEAQRK